MPNDSYLPKRESELVTWSNNFEALVRVNFAQYGVTSGQATAYTALNTAWRNSYQTANDNSTRTPSSITTKNTAKANLIDGPGGIRDLVAIIQSFPGTTDTMRSDLEITVRDTEPTPVPTPTKAPALTIESTTGRTLRLRLRDVDNPDSRGKPAGVNGALILCAPGETPPSDLSQWQMMLNTTRPLVDLTLPLSVPDGKVWVAAYWYNTKGRSGPATNPPQSTFIGGLSQAA